MGYKRWPHTATIGWRNAGTFSTVGTFTPGTLNTIWGACNIQKVRMGSYKTALNGDVTPLHYNVFWATVINTIFNDTQDLAFQFNGVSYQVLDITNFTKHTELEI